MNTNTATTPRRLTVAIATLVALTWLASLLALPFAPAEIPSHWGINGQPDAYSSRFVGLFQLPAIMTVLALVLHFIPRIDPKRNNYSSFAGAYGVIQMAVMLFLAALQATIVAVALGWSLDVSLVIAIIFGLMFAALGNVMGKLRPNWFAGIRTPWTLSSPDVWTRTHRLGGTLMVLVGLLNVVAAPLLAAPARMVLLLGSVFGWATFTIGYSYWLWRSMTAEN